VTVNQYLSAQPKEARVVLRKVREAIRTALPNAAEAIAYKMPVYTIDGVFVLYMAGWKAHYSLYPITDSLAAAFADELQPYERSKGGVRFPYSEPVPVKLIARIARFKADELRARDRARTGRTAQLTRIRRLCKSLPSVAEKLSHGAPTFFVQPGKGVFAMFADHHHEDGRLALWVPVPAGQQALMIEEVPATYFRPPYMGTAGWVGIDLARIKDDALRAHLHEAWRLNASKMPSTGSTSASRSPAQRGRRGRTQ